MKILNIIGKRVPSIDSPKKVSGSTLYTQDVKFKNMLVGKILRSPLPHAKILNIDVSQAERLRGVKAIVTARDTIEVKYGISIQDKHLLAVDKVRYVGDEIAGVAAIDEDIAQEALTLIKVDYEELEPVFEIDESLAPQAPKIHDTVGNIATTLEINCGNVESLFDKCDYVFEETYTTSNPQHCNLETLGSISYFDANGRLTVWASTQVPFRFRAFLSQILGIGIGKIKVVQVPSGGAFGAKAGAPQPLYGISALLAIKSKNPVKIENSRKEEFATNRHRLPCRIKLRIGCTKDGQLLAKEAEILADCGAYAGPGNNPLILELMAMRADNLYRIKNIKTSAKLVYTNTVPSGSFRGFGGPQMHFALECLLDVVAENLRTDPIELRLKNGTKERDITVHGWKVNSCGLEESLRKTKDAMGFKIKRFENQNLRRGIGFACAIHGTGKRPPEDNDSSTAMIKVHEDGSVSVISGEGDIGQGANTVFSQIVSEELGIDMRDIHIVPVDTDVAPYCRGAFGSRVTAMGGNAIWLAASKVKAKLIKIASEKMEANPHDVECSGGRVFIKGSPNKGYDIGTLVRENLYRKGGAPLVCTASFDPDTQVADPETKYGNSSIGYIFGSQGAEVEIDKETGKVKILKIVGAYDLGRALNPLTAEGQIEGGIVQGIGYALLEELKIDMGEVLNPNFTDYKIFTASDIPEIKSILVESNDPQGPFGAKGVGEIVLIPTAPAIINAIYDAIGIRFKELPVTSEKILNALRGEES